jgi:lysophospholipase L1-like esterase
VVDLGPLFLNPFNHWPTGDTFHPNDAGHTAIAQAVLVAA